MPRKLTTEIFIERAKQAHGDRYDYSKSIYTNDKSKIEIICSKHGSFHQAIGEHVRMHQGCPKCGKENQGIAQRTSIDTIISKIYKIYGMENIDTSLIDYKGVFIPITLKCIKHNTVFNTKLDDINRGSISCPCCKPEMHYRRTNLSTRTKRFNHLINRAIKIHGGRYEYDESSFVNNAAKMKIKCPEHGWFEQTPGVHLDDKCGCPICSMPHGEAEVINYLDSQNIKYIHQHAIKINGSRHVFDFYLPESNTIVEYHGEQHYRPIEFWGGDAGLRKQQERDKIKADYCLSNNLQLIVIPYKEDVSKYLEQLH